MKLRSAVLSVLGPGVLVLGVLGAPVQAAPAGPVSVTVTVVDVNGNPAEGVDVDLVDADGRRFELTGADPVPGVDRATRADGRATYEGTIALAPGRYTVQADEHEDPTLPGELRSGLLWKPTQRTVTLTDGENTPRFVIDRFPRVVGQVVAPSGRQVQGIGVEAWWRNPATGRFGKKGFAFSHGSYDIRQLQPGRYAILAGVVPINDYGVSSPCGAQPCPGADQVFTTDVANFDLAANQLRQDSGLTIANWRVRCTTAGFNVASPRAGHVELAVRSTSPATGLTNPLGRIVVKRGSTLVASIPVTGATQKVLVGGQPTGKKVSYWAKYYGGDCLDWSTTKSVVVKK